jgi:hypothetical protein
MKGRMHFTKPLPSKYKRDTHTDIPYRLMGEIYEVGRLNGLRCYDIHTKFHEDYFGNSVVNMGDSEAHRQHGDLISLLTFFQNKESWLTDTARSRECVIIDVCNNCSLLRKMKIGLCDLHAL